MARLWLLRCWALLLALLAVESSALENGSTLVLNASNASNSSNDSNSTWEFYEVSCYTEEPIGLIGDTASCNTSGSGPFDAVAFMLKVNVSCYGTLSCQNVTGEQLVELLRFHRQYVYFFVAAFLTSWLVASFYGLSKAIQFWPTEQTPHGLSAHYRNAVWVQSVSSSVILFLWSSSQIVTAYWLSSSFCSGLDDNFNITNVSLKYAAYCLGASCIGHVIVVSSLTGMQVLDRIRGLQAERCYFLPKRRVRDLLYQLIDAEPVWLPGSQPLPDGLPREGADRKPCYTWKNGSIGGLRLDELDELFNCQSTRLVLQVTVELEDLFSRHSVQVSGGIFGLQVDGQWLENRADVLTLTALVCKVRRCAGHLFWSHFFSALASNIFMFGLAYAAWESSYGFKREVLHLTKKVRLLPDLELEALTCSSRDAQSGGVLPVDVRQIKRVREWRQRARRAAMQAPSSHGHQESPPILNPPRHRDPVTLSLLQDPQLRLFVIDQPPLASARSPHLPPKLPRSPRRAPVPEASSYFSSYLAEASAGPRFSFGGLAGPAAIFGRQSEILMRQAEDQEEELAKSETDGLISPAQGLDRFGEHWESEDHTAPGRHLEDSATQEDWFRLLSKAEAWLLNSYVDLIQRQPFSLGDALESACEVVISGLRCGRLRTDCCKQLLPRLTQELRAELQQALVAVDRAKIDRLCAACDPLNFEVPEADLIPHSELPILIEENLAKLLDSHLQYVLEMAMHIRDRSALAQSLIETFRLCGDLQEQQPRIYSAQGFFNLNKLALKALRMYRLQLFCDARLASGHVNDCDPDTVLSHFSNIWCQDGIGGPRSLPVGYLDRKWMEWVHSDGFRDDMQALFDITGQRAVCVPGRAPVLSCNLEVVEIKRIADPDSLRAYLARRVEIKEALQTVHAGHIGECLMNQVTGPWTGQVVRSVQGVWLERDRSQTWVVQGEQVLSGALLVAETLNPDGCTQLHAEHGRMDLNAWHHGMPSLPDPSDTNPELVWVIAPWFTSSKTPHTQLVGRKSSTGVLGRTIRWTMVHPDPQTVDWESEPAFLGSWVIAGHPAVIMTPTCFETATDWLDRAQSADKASKGHAWYTQEVRRATWEAEKRGEMEACDYYLYFKEALHPIWMSGDCGLHGCIFRSTYFKGNTDRLGRQLTLIPSEAAHCCEEAGEMFQTTHRGIRTHSLVDLGPKNLEIAANETWLLQGTRAGITDDTPASEVQLRLMSAHHGTFWGPGIYLTDSAAMADECTEINQDGLGTILLTRVCLGRTHSRAEGDRRSMQACHSNSYHSVKGNRRPCNEFVVYDPSQAYAEYIIWYRRKDMYSALQKERATSPLVAQASPRCEGEHHSSLFWASHPDLNNLFDRGGERGT